MSIDTQIKTLGTQKIETYSADTTANFRGTVQGLWGRRFTEVQKYKCRYCTNIFTQLDYTWILHILLHIYYPFLCILKRHDIKDFSCNCTEKEKSSEMHQIFHLTAKILIDDLTIHNKKIHNLPSRLTRPKYFFNKKNKCLLCGEFIPKKKKEDSTKELHIIKHAILKNLKTNTTILKSETNLFDWEDNSSCKLCNESFPPIWFQYHIFPTISTHLLKHVATIILGAEG